MPVYNAIYFGPPQYSSGPPNIQILTSPLVFVIDEVLEPTRDTLACDEVEGSNVAKAPTEKDVSQDTFKYEGRHFNNKLYHILDCSVQSNVNSNMCIV